MRLRLGGAGADGRPGNQFRQVLRHDRVERFGTCGKSQLRHVQQQFPGQQNALFDVEGVVQVGIIDQSLPAHGGAWLLEVHTHDQQQGGFDPGGQLLEPLCVFARRRHIVNRTGAHDHEQASIAAFQYAAHGFPRFQHRPGRPNGQGQTPFDLLRRRQ